MDGIDTPSPWLRAIDRTSAVLATIGGVAVVLLALTIAADVAGRYLFGTPFGPGLDLVSMVWMPTVIGLGLAYALRQDEHIRVSLLTASASPRVQRMLEVASMLATVLVAIALAYFSAVRALRAMNTNEMAITTHWLALAPWMWVVAIGFVALALQGVAQLVRAVITPDFHIVDETEAVILEARQAVGSTGDTR